MYNSREGFLNPLSISYIKKEIRVIGFAARRDEEEFIFIGVVFRGNSVFEGVISGRGRNSLDELIISKVKGSKHYGQIRVIILDELTIPESIDPNNIWENTGKPVLLLKRYDFFDPRYMFRYRNRVVLATGILEKPARLLMDVVYQTGALEAIRLAVIILQGIPKLHNV